MENVRIISRVEHKCSGHLAIVDCFKNAFQLQTVGTGIGRSHVVVAGERRDCFAMLLRQFMQVDRFAGKCLERGECLFEPFSQLVGGIEIGRQYEVAWIVAVQFVPRCIKGRERMHEAG